MVVPDEQIFRLRASIVLECQFSTKSGRWRLSGGCLAPGWRGGFVHLRPLWSLFNNGLRARSEMRISDMAFKVDAAKIKRWREERHWSQEHLAELAGIGLRTIQRIENGEKASQESAMALAAAFGVDATTLSVDIEEEARKAIELKAEEAEARMRLYFYIHVASFVVVLTIFGFIAVMDGDWGVLKIASLFVIPLVAHGVAVLVTQLTDRHERKFGKTDVQ